MKDQQNLEGNKAMAKFMGYKLITPSMRTVPSDWDKSYWQKDYPEKQDVLAGEHQLMAYHTSWDWLMPVVEKIEALVEDKCYFSVVIKDRTCSIYHMKKIRPYLVSRGESLTKLEAVYTACLQFIKFYNSLK